MIPEKYRWLVPVIGFAWLLGSPILAAWTVIGAVMAAAIGLIILKTVAEITEEKKKKNDNDLELK